VVIKGTHLSGETQQPRPLLQIDERVVGLEIPRHTGQPPAKFNGLFNVVISLVYALLFLSLLRSCRREQR
jgi:hypothetical protein